MARTTARERLLTAAGRRFYEDGVTATGIDAITAEAGVAKMSLYNNFANKAELVRAYIDARHDEWLGLYAARVAESAGLAQPDAARARILAVFDAYIDHASDAYDGGFRGCGLLNAAAEFPSGHPARQAVREHKEHVERLLGEQLSVLAASGRAEELAEHLSFLLEGAVARAGLEGNASRLGRARALAASLLADVDAAPSGGAQGTVNE